MLDTVNQSILSLTLIRENIDQMIHTNFWKTDLKQNYINFKVYV